jgi:DNA-binding IclR family transcriptional regulator
MEQPDLGGIGPNPAEEVAPGTPSVPVLGRALAIIEFLAESRNGATLPEISRRLKMPKSSAHTILVTLLRKGYITRSPRTQRFSLGFKLFAVANKALDGLPIREVAVPFMRQLSLTTHLTVHLGILEQNEAILIAKIDPPGVTKLSTWIGRRMELHCTGIGKALIAYLPKEEQLRLVHSRVFARHNESTIVSPKRFMDEIDRIRRDGYSIDDEEDEVGFRCLGVPILDSEDELLGALSFAGTVLTVNNENTKDLVAKMKQTAAQIAQAMADGDAGRK